MNRRLLLGLELAIVAGLYVADARGLVPFSKIPFLLALGWLSLRLRGLHWRDVGLARPERWSAALLVGVGAGLALELIQTYLTEPALAHFTGQPPDLSDWRFLVGHPALLPAVLGLVWLLSLAEELVFRGYLMRRLAGLFGDGSAAWGASLILSSALFGASHLDQGLTGMVVEGIAGLALGALYLAAKRNLWVPILAHLSSNTLAMVLICLGRYPGV